MADFNLSDEQIKKIKDKFGNKNVEQAQMIDRAIKEGASPDLIMNNLSKKQQESLKKILSDKAAIEKLLASDQAKNLINKLMGDK